MAETTFSRKHLKKNQKADPLNELSLEWTCLVSLLQESPFEADLKVPISNSELMMMIKIAGIITFFERRGNRNGGRQNMMAAAKIIMRSVDIDIFL